MYLLRSLSFVLFLVLLTACNSSTETEEPIPYMSLHVGDVRQYFSESDSTYETWNIVGETYRTDGQKVFISESIADSTNRRFFNFIRDGYMYSTQLDTISTGWDLPNNPYVEQRLAKLYPEEGDNWIMIEGDEPSRYFMANYVGEKITPAKDFDNVFGYTLDSILTVYYAKGFGHIGVLVSDNKFSIYLNYLKIDGKEYGEYVPQNQLPKQNALGITTLKPKFGFFGERLK